MNGSINSVAWRGVRNVLVVRLDNLGDVLMSTPAIHAIKQSAPDMRVTLLTSRSGAAAARHLPPIDEVISYDAPWVKGPSHSDQGDRRLIAALRRHQFDAAVIFTVCTQSALPAALTCRLAGIPLRLAHSRENPYDLLTDWVPDSEVCADGMRHEVKRQLDLVRAVGFHADDERLLFRCTPADVIGMRRKLSTAGGDCSRPYIVVHPGASAASRRYPAERFGVAADRIARESGCHVVFSGGRDEHELVDRARAAMHEPGLSLTGQLTLGEMAALIAGAQLTLCNNSGPAHISAALGTPVVVLYALTNPQHTPWKVQARVLNHDMPCRNCLKSSCPQLHHGCLLKVDVDSVVNAAMELIHLPSARPHPAPVLQRVSMLMPLAG
jgi:lipopolysaccharide heptosyltransferase II